MGIESTAVRNVANVRIGWVDALKAILITLVVAGHVFGMASHYVPDCDRKCYDVIFKVIYSFHMPAFFLLAGLMTSEASQCMSTVSRFRKLFKRLLVPYFFFGFLGAVIYTFVMPFFGNVSAGSTGYYEKFMDWGWWHPWVSLLYGAAFPGTDGFRCNSVLWFLPCMFSVKFLGGLFLRMVGPAPRAVRTIILMIIPIALLGWAKQYVAIPSLPYGLSKVLWCLPFFLVGYCLRPIFVKGRVNTSLFNPTRRIVCLLVVIAFVVLVWILPNDTVYFRRYLRWYVIEVTLGILGSLLCMGIAMRMPKILSNICFQLSVTSIGIMFLHKYIVLSVVLFPLTRRFLCNGGGGAFVASLLTITVSTAAAWAISTCARRFAPWTIGGV